jgi:uncharacterized protein YraI
MIRHSVVAARTVMLAIPAALLLVLGLGPPAAAEPATPVSYPASATATRLTGYAFDRCEAPSAAAMDAWVGSRYRGVAVYIGGRNRTCDAQPHLTPAWVAHVARDWRLIPIYLGHQAPCADRRREEHFTLSNAAAKGTADAVAAVAAARALGLLPGSALYGDMENYDPADSTCRTAVLRYVSAWTRELHRVGFLSGMYVNLGSGAQHLAAAYDSSSYARPDALWIARYDHVASLTGWAGVPDTRWANHQRAKQYWAERTETYGGVTMTVDSNRWDAPVATVAYPYTAVRPLHARSGPGTSYPVTATYPAGTRAKVVCQTPGSVVRGTAVWDKLSTGAYVPDTSLDTPSHTTYSPPLPRCRYPYQVMQTTLNERLGPSSSHPVKATLPAGALAWVLCQTAGAKVYTTAVWDRLDDGYYVTDYYVATPSSTTYSRPIPRC